MKMLTHRNLIGPTIRSLRRQRGWTQADFALHLKTAGWNINRSGVSKIEARLVHVDDQEICYLRQVLRVEVRDLFPTLNPHKTIREGIAELLTKEPADAFAAV
jgi:transcriptional regulator with XRE-family HTH domain